MLLVTVLLVPLIIGICYSFRKFSAFRSEFVGLGQYHAMLSDTVLRAGARQYAVVDGRPACSSSSSWASDWRLLLDKPVLSAASWSRRGVPALGGAVLPSGLTWAWLFNPIIGPLPHWLLRTRAARPSR